MKVLVVGERCFDIFRYGEVNRICPEAPVPIFSEKNQKLLSMGMAANVLGNLISLRPEWEIDSYLSPTAATKTRYIDLASNYILLRVDEDNPNSEQETASIDGLDEVLKAKGTTLDGYDAIVISDYDKGFMSEAFMSFIIVAADCPVFLDTKKVLGEWAYGVDYVKINKTEFDRNAMMLAPFGHPKDFTDNLIITSGSEGATLYRKTAEDHFPTESGDMFDVSGAGDSFLAGLVVKYLETEKIEEAIPYANKVAAMAVSKKGVVQVKSEWVD